jgi:hypothetical protein
VDKELGKYVIAIERPVAPPPPPPTFIVLRLPYSLAKSWVAQLGVHPQVSDEDGEAWNELDNVVNG